MCCLLRDQGWCELENCGCTYEVYFPTDAFWIPMQYKMFTSIGIPIIKMSWPSDRYQLHIHTLFKLSDNIHVPYSIYNILQFMSPFSYAFSWIKKKNRLRFPALFQIIAWRQSGDKPLSESMVISLLTLICVTRPHWVNISNNTCRAMCVNSISTPWRCFIYINK